MAVGREYWRYISQIRAEETIGLVATRTKTEVPLKSVTCHVTIHGFIADVEAILHYESEARDDQDSVFVFPLENGSTVYSFTTRINERLLVGECQSKYAALRRYTDAVEEGHQAAMLILEESENNNTFRCGVGPIPPLTPVIIRLSYVQELNIGVDKGVHFTLPSLMNPAQRPVIGGFQRQWSLMSQTSLTRSTLNRSSLRPGFLASPRHIPSALDFELEVKGQYKVMAIKTPRDQLTGSFLNQEDTHVKGTLAEPFKFDHDLTLGVYYENVNVPSVIVEPGDPNQDGLLNGTVVMVNFAPEISEEGPMLGETKDFVLMVDCSSERHFDRIREAVSYFLRSIPVGAQFNLCTYAETFKFLFPQGSQPYSDSTFKQALNFQKTIEPASGSFPSLHGPICHLYRRYELPPGGERQIVVISTGSERFSSVICKVVHDNTHNTRVHTIGICPDHTPSIVTDLAVAGKGTAQYIHDSSTGISTKLLRCLRCALQPNVRDLQLEWSLPEGVCVSEVPSQLPTLLCGERCIIYAVLTGEIPPDAMNLVRISGVNHRLYFSQEVVFYVPEPEIDLNGTGSLEQNYPLHRLMAKSWMDEAFSKCYTDVPGTIAGQEANIVSPFTTFIVTDKAGGPQPVPFMDHSSLPNDYLPHNLRTKNKIKRAMPLKKWLALAGGAIFKRKTKRKPLPSSELTQMITLQKWDGSWDLDKALAELLCVPLKIIKKENPYKVVQEDSSWATALAVVWMEGYHEEKVSEWDLIADKATHYLKNRLTDSDELLRRAALLLGLQIEELADNYW